MHYVRVTPASDAVLTLNVIVSDPWDFVGPDGSNVFSAVTARNRGHDWVVDFEDRLGDARFFARTLTPATLSDLRSGATVEGSLIGLPDAEGDAALWRGGPAARCQIRLS